jgi:outer membrane receptor protein involved in Fe transport
VGLGTSRTDRDFGTRTLSYVSNQQGNAMFLKQPHQIFKDENIENGLLQVREATVNSDFYQADQTNPYAFAMIDQHFSEKFRVITGVRYEQFRQVLTGSNTDGSPVNIDTTYRNLLPSLSLSYSMSERSRLRAAVSRTVSRPTLREIAPFSYYNFEEVAIVEGEPRLGQATINNYDLRYEFFPTLSHLIAVNLFYKQFNNPIEQVVAGSSALSRRFSYRNAPTAINYGAEFEYRFKLSQSAAVLRNLTFLGNLAYINSEIDLTGVQGFNPLEVKRPLQGQSPYVINSGLNYNSFNTGTDFTLMFNRIGRRIWQVGYEGIPSIYEAPRSVFDLNISQRIFKNGEIRFTVQDILNQYQHFYIDIEKDGRFTPNSQGFFLGKDQVIKSQRFGTTFSGSISWKF